MTILGINFESFVHINCPKLENGDELNFLRQFNLDSSKNNLVYYGLNKDQEVVAHNNFILRAKDKSKYFINANPVLHPLPRADAILLDDQDFLSDKKIWRMLSNIKDSKARYLLVTKNFADLLSGHPFFFPDSEVVIKIKLLGKFFAIYEMEKILFLLEFCHEESSQLRSQIFNYMYDDFKTFEKMMGHEKFGEFLVSYRDGWGPSKEFIAKKDISDLFAENDYFGLKLYNHYYRMLFQMELNQVNDEWNFINEQNFYHTYIIVLGYINFLLKEFL